MKTIYFCVALSLLAGCSSTALIGKYRATDSDNFVQVNFEFKPDSVLEVTFWSDMTGESKKVGKWYSKGDTVYTPNELAGSVFSYEFVKNEAIQNFQIHVFDKDDNEGINLAHITLNGDVKLLKPEGNGLYKIDTAHESIKVVNVEYLGQQYKILIDHNELERSNELKIYFEFSKSTNDFAYSQSWVFKNKKLYPLDSGHAVLTKRK